VKNSSILCSVDLFSELTMNKRHTKILTAIYWQIILSMATKSICRSGSTCFFMKHIAFWWTHDIVNSQDPISSLKTKFTEPRKRRQPAGRATSNTNSKKVDFQFCEWWKNLQI
jgi:hypothetical protein